MHVTERRNARDAGFTLIELLIVVAVLLVVAVPMGMALSTFFGNNDATAARLQQSDDAQLAATYFAQDVASIGTRTVDADATPLVSVETAVPATGGTYPCGSTGTTVIRFVWDDYTAVTSSVLRRVAYVVTTTNGVKQLHRLTCSGSATVVSDLLLVQQLSGTPTVTCNPGCASATLRTVTLNVVIAAQGAEDYRISLTGARRQT